MSTRKIDDALLTSVVDCLHAEVPTIVFLSKIDTYDPDVIGNDLAKTFHSSRLLHLVEVSEPNLPKEMTSWGLGIYNCSTAFAPLPMCHLSNPPPPSSARRQKALLLKRCKASMLVLFNGCTIRLFDSVADWLRAHCHQKILVLITTGTGGDCRSRWTEGHLACQEPEQ